MNTSSYKEVFYLDKEGNEHFNPPKEYIQLPVKDLRHSCTFEIYEDVDNKKYYVREIYPEENKQSIDIRDNFTLSDLIIELLYMKDDYEN